MSYASMEDLRVELSDTTTADATLQAALDWATDWIDSTCRRRFEAVTATRYYSLESVERVHIERHVELLLSTGGRLLLDEDLLAVTTLTNGDGAEIPSGGYRLVPRNEQPAWAIELKGAYGWAFADADSEIAVAGSWGYSATPPPAVAGSCVRLAAWKVRAKNLIESTSLLSGTALPPRSHAFPTEVDETLAPFVRL